jgi:crotonobetainyl-CoA:carnitine CoA-transferase CaiB-like acyl-CoA transferase
MARLPGFESARSLEGAELEAMLEARFATLSVDEWVEGLRSVGLGAHRACRVSQMMSDPVAVAHGVSVMREHAGYGMVRHNGPAQWFSACETVPGRPTPHMGADAASVLADIGRAGDLEALVAAGAVGVARDAPA